MSNVDQIIDKYEKIRIEKFQKTAIENFKLLRKEVFTKLALENSFQSIQFWNGHKDFEAFQTAKKIAKETQEKIDKVEKDTQEADENLVIALANEADIRKQALQTESHIENVKREVFELSACYKATFKQFKIAEKEVDKAAEIWVDNKNKSLDKILLARLKQTQDKSDNIKAQTEKARTNLQVPYDKFVYAVVTQKLALEQAVIESKEAILEVQKMEMLYKEALKESITAKIKVLEFVHLEATATMQEAQTKVSKTRKEAKEICDKADALLKILL